MSLARRAAPSRRRGGSGRALGARCALFAVLTLAVACAADSQARRADRDVEPARPAAVAETRTGIPVLMDLPVIGFLFERRTVQR